MASGWIMKLKKITKKSFVLNGYDTFFNEILLENIPFIFLYTLYTVIFKHVAVILLPTSEVNLSFSGTTRYFVWSILK